MNRQYDYYNRELLPRYRAVRRNSTDSSYSVNAASVQSHGIGMIVIVIILVLIIALLIVFRTPSNMATSTGTSTTTTSGCPNTNEYVIHIIEGAEYYLGENEYNPRTAFACVNQPVRWQNDALTVSHTSTSNTDLWDSGVLLPGESFTFTFTEPGTYAYHCDLHPWMIGTIAIR
jgi:plastocyanin